MNEKIPNHLSYSDAIENVARLEHEEAEIRTYSLMEVIEKIRNEQGEDAIPESLLAKMTEASQRETRTLHDWLDALDLK